MVLGALLTFCICKRRKQNRRIKGKTSPTHTSTVKSLGTSLLESAKGRKSQKGKVRARGYGWLCCGLRLISEGRSSGVTTEDV